jgi:hypothetical protein
MLKGIGSSPLAKMELREDEVSDLISQQAKYSRDHFLPECDWKGNAQPMAFGSTVVKFSNPIFSSNSQLAVTNVSFVPSADTDPMWLAAKGIFAFCEGSLPAGSHSA